MTIAFGGVGITCDIPFGTHAPPYSHKSKTS